LNPSSIDTLVGVILETRSRGGAIYIAGNGGSASAANHIALDWMLGSNLHSPPLRVVSLSESPSSISATGNDLDFDEIFSRQLNSLALPGDLVVAVSASGNSRNLLSLVAKAREKECQVAAIVGFDGGALLPVVDVAVHIPTDLGDYGVSEDLHLMVGHVVKEALIDSQLR